MTRRWCPCGSPLHTQGGLVDGTDECRVCWLVKMTSQQVVWDEQERIGYTAEGEALGSVIVRSTLEDPDFSPEPFNSTEGSKATSTWSPCNGPRVPCDHCGCCDDTVYKRRQHTAYHHDEQNFAVLCSECQTEANEYWEERWAEYYEGIM